MSVVLIVLYPLLLRLDGCKSQYCTILLERSLSSILLRWIQVRHRFRFVAADQSASALNSSSSVIPRLLSQLDTADNCCTHPCAHQRTCSMVCLSRMAGIFLLRIHYQDTSYLASFLDSDTHIHLEHKP